LTLEEREEDEEMSDEAVRPAIRYAFGLNLVTKYVDAPYQWTDSSAPKGMGLILGYHDNLTRFDASTVPNVFRQYFYHGFGDSEEECAENFSTFRSAWGNLHKSDFGNRVSHLAKAIDIGMMTQTQVCPIIVAHNYAGCLLRGAGWRLRIEGRDIEPCSMKEIEDGLKVVDGHSNALWKIFQKLSFVDNESRVAAYTDCRSVAKLAEYIDALSLNGGTAVQKVVADLAKHLSFDDERPMTATAKNIEVVLSYVKDPLKNLSDLPYRHPSTLFSTSRRHIAWSAFGSYAPSFRIPGGKNMLLDQAWRISLPARGSRPAEHRDVSKVAAQMVPLELALQHLDAVFTEKSLWNPFGNTIVNVSASNLNKVFEGDSCQMILAAFRNALSVTVSTGSGGSKRKNDSAGEENARKKRKGAMDF
jgi:hypothetical protein